MTRTTTRQGTWGLAALAALLLLAPACDEGFVEGPVDFTSEGAAAVRQAACQQEYDKAARKGAATEQVNASTLWSVSPYLVLVPNTGEGHVLLNIDAPHFDWLLYTRSDVEIRSLEGPELAFNGPVAECPELDLVEYGVHHPSRMSWPLVLRGEPMSRAHFYAGLAPTPHSDLDDAGHAGHMLTGDANVPSHGGH